MILSSAELEAGMCESSLYDTEVPRTQAKTKVLISELVALAGISEAIPIKEVQCWGVFLCRE